jgi:CubicO group peptidase (beta-lactamase class C family)
MKFHLFLALFICSSIASFAQQNGKMVLAGRIVDADNKEGIAYASLGISQKGIGTITNGTGEFIFNLERTNIADSIRISCIGYKTKTVAVVELNSMQKPLTIALAKSNIPLKEVTVEYRDPMKIIQKAIERIPQNYINTPHVIRGFYRENTMKGNTPLQLSEAVFDIYNFGYGDKRQDMFRLVKARDEKNERDFHDLEAGQKPAAIFNDDIVKRIAGSDILDRDGMKKHDYEVKGIVDINGSLAYEIDFAEKPGITGNTYRGKIFIDIKSYAFIYFDYGLNPEGMKSLKSGNFAQRTLNNLMGVTLRVKSNHNRIRYQKVDDKWVLANVVGDNDLYIRAPNLGYDMVISIKFNYVVTQVDTTQTTPFKEKMRSGEHILDHDTNEGEEFWKDYNILLPDYNTEELIGQIQAINNIANLKKKFEEREKKLPGNPALLLDSMLTYYHANGQFNGAALVKSKGKVILSKSYGYADKEKQLTGNEHTTYRIGSLSKSFTSVIINQLMAEGKVNANAQVKTYIPWFANGDVTIDQLLTHRSGIPEYFSNDSLERQILTKSFTLKEVVQKLCSDTLEFKNGTSFHYSNSNFAVLALIAQEVTQTPFEILLKQRIFDPLQMTDTYFGLYKGVDSHQAIGYSNGAKEAFYNVENTEGAGGISSSTADLLKYHDGLLADKLMPKAQQDTMLKKRVEFKDYNAWYDYGWMTDKSAFTASQRHVITYHPGTDLGFFSMFAREADTDSCIILLNNTGEFPRYDMADLILDIIN